MNCFSTIIFEAFDKAYYKSRFGSDKSKCMELFNDITREWKKDEWVSLKNMLSSKYNGLIDINSFSNAFKNKFEDSNRSYAHVSFGYETTIYIPLSVIKIYEKNNSTDKKSDRLSKFVSTAISELISEIE